MKRIRALLLLASLVSIQLILSTVIAETLIKTSSALIPVEEINIGDSLIEYDNKTLTTSQVRSISVSYINHIAKIRTQKGVFYASIDQKFFDPKLNKWVTVKNLKPGTFFLNFKMNHIECFEIEIIAIGPIKIYHISTTYPHTFFATAQELLMHNNPPLVVINLL